MPSARRGAPERTQPPKVRRRQILDAASALAVEHGFANVSIAQVAQMAGVANGTVYLHFESRQGLAVALLADLWERMLVEPQQVMARPGLSWSAKLDAVVASWIRFELDNHDLHHEIFHLIADTAGTEDPWEPSRRLLVDLLRSGGAAGEFDVPEPEITADFLLFAYAGPCHHQTGDSAAITRTVQELFRRVVGSA